MSVAIVGTLDTKGEELAFCRDVLVSQGVAVELIDVGVMGEPAVAPDVDAATVASAAGTTLEALREAGDRGEAMTAMGRGAATILEERAASGELDGVLGAGGSGNTSVATAAMRALPLGVPKLMVSTMASGDTEPYVDATDVMMLYSVADVEGLNGVTRRVLANAALAMAGMASGEPPADGDDRPTVAISMFGVTTPCVKRARAYLEDRGYETIVFHATGTGGRALESLVRQGLVDGVLDVTTTEWADQHVGGVLAAGEDRLTAPGEMGIPHVVSVGALDMVNFGPRGSVPERFADRLFHEHNPEVTLMRTTPTETAAIGEIVAEKLGGATGPVSVFLPLGGVSALDAPGEPFEDPAADEALFDALRAHLPGTVELVEREEHINDEAFALAMARRLDELLRDAGSGPTAA